MRLVARVRETACVWLPLAVVVALALPSVVFLLPSYYCQLGESYQPLRALRFFASLGADYHKYGPMANFLLAPGYALSMAWWWISGSFTRPSGDFPYGFEEPLQQISFLILQGRLVFLALFVGLCAFLLVSLRKATPNRVAIALAFLVGIGTNHSALTHAAMTRPDGPTYAFLAASLGVYVRILYDGFSLGRGVWLSLLAVFAISTKEIAGPTYVLPYLGLGALLIEEARKDPLARPRLSRIAVASLATGVGSYALLNIVYAPSTWLLRMSHWLAGSGADSAVWGGVSSGDFTRFDQALTLGASFLNTLGPGGTAIAVAALAALAAARPRRETILLLLPFLSTLLLALIPMGYVSDNFTTVATVCLVPPLAVGLGELLRPGSPFHRPIAAAVALGIALNLVFANFAWIRLEGLFPRVVERELREDPPGDATISLPDVHPEVPGKSRLTWLGYHVDSRSLQQIIDAAPEARPDRIYLSSGMRGFLDDALEQPARAEMLRGEGIDVAEWKGIEALGYQLTNRVEARTPAWFFFDWMPAVQYWKGVSGVEIYERLQSAAPGR